VFRGEQLDLVLAALYLFVDGAGGVAGGRLDVRPLLLDELVLVEQQRADVDRAEDDDYRKQEEGRLRAQLHRSSSSTSR
jgi:hypothetical protein